LIVGPFQVLQPFWSHHQVAFPPLLEAGRGTFQAAEAGLIPANPVRGISFVEEVKAAPKRLDINAQYALLRALQERGRKRDVALITLMLHSGLRVSDVSNLKVTEVVEVPEAESPVDNATNGAVDAFYESLGHSIIEDFGELSRAVVEELMPPVAQRLDKPNHIPASGGQSFPYPRPQEALRPCSIGDLVADGAELFLEHMDGAQLVRNGQDSTQLGLLLCGEIAPILQQHPPASLQCLVQSLFPPFIAFL
jgi:hypothetical protein